MSDINIILQFYLIWEKVTYPRQTIMGSRIVLIISLGSLPSLNPNKSVLTVSWPGSMENPYTGFNSSSHSYTVVKL